MRPQILPPDSFPHSSLVNERNHQKATFSQGPAPSSLPERPPPNALEAKLAIIFRSMVTKRSERRPNLASELPNRAAPRPRLLHTCRARSFSIRVVSIKTSQSVQRIDKAVAIYVFCRPKLVAELAGLKPRMSDRKLPLFPSSRLTAVPRAPTRLSRIEKRTERTSLGVS